MSKIEITKHLKLPFQFNEQKLLEDLDQVLKTEWIAHFNKQDYQGKWNSIALHAPAGNANNIFALSTNEFESIEETEHIQNCNYFKEVLSHFHCPLLTVRLLNLGVGAVIKPHCDYNLGYENDCFRLHIPITTNPDVEFILADTSLIMLPGECWYTNVNFTHSVANKGKTDRIHLVLDGKRNEWSDNLFFSLVPQESLLFTLKPSYDSDTIETIIAELKQLDIPNLDDHIAALKAQSNNS